MSYQENKLMNLKDGQLLLKTLDERMKITGFAPVMTNPHPDTIKTVENCAESMGIGFEIPISPVQDLHGYDAPWVGGAGKNLLPMVLSSIKSGNTNGTWSGNAYTINGVTFTVQTDDNDNIIGILCTGTASDGATIYLTNGHISATGYDGCLVNGCPSNGSSSTYALRIGMGNSSWTTDVKDTGSGATISIGSYTTIRPAITIYSGYAIGTSGLLFKPMIRLSSVTDATFEPYENICPISGYTGVDITRVKQLYDKYTVQKRKYVNSSGNIADSTTEYDDVALNLTDYFDVEAGKSYTLKAEIIPRDVPQTVAFAWYNGTTFIDRSTYSRPSTGNSYSFDAIAPTGANGARVNFCTSNFDTVLIAESDTIATYPFTWDSAGTVYGGNVTVNEDGSGKLTKNVELLTITGDMVAEYGTGSDVANRVHTILNYLTQGYKANIVCCNSYPVVTNAVSVGNIGICFHSTNGYIYIYNDQFADLTDAQAKINANPIVCVLELATPISYDLTPQQVTSMFGTNTVWNSIGEFAMSYHLDPKTYVDDTAGIAGSIEKTDSTEEAVKTLSDCADNLPMEVAVAINPAQAGSGDPYPAGGGKNIWDRQTYALSQGYYIRYSNGTSNGGNQDYSATLDYIPVPSGHEGETLYSNFTVGGSAPGVAFYDTNKDFISDSGAKNFPVTVPTGAKYFRFTINATDASNDLIVTFSSDTSYAPYENIRSISGWDVVNITGTGKNLMPKMQLAESTGSVVVTINEDGSVKVNGASGSSAKAVALTPVFTLNAGTTYIMSGCPSGGSTSTYRMDVRDITGSRLDPEFSAIVDTGDGATLTPTTTHQVRFAVRVAGNYTINNKVFYPMLRFSSADTTYEPYKGNIYPISLPTTAYGGTLTVNKDGSGRLYLDTAFDDLGNLSWFYDATYTRFYANIVGLKLMDTRTMNLICSAYRTISDGRAIGNVPNNSIYNGSNQNQIYIKTDQYTDPATFKNAVTGQTVVYELATPVVFDFTAQQIRSLLGTNNLWAESGNVLRVVYGADTKMYIDNLFNSIVPAEGVSF